MTVNGHWQYKLTIPVHVFCVNQDDLRKILFDLWQNVAKWIQINGSSYYATRYFP